MIVKAHGVTQPPFSDFLRERVGANWVLARRTPRVLRQYGEDVMRIDIPNWDWQPDEPREIVTPSRSSRNPSATVECRAG